MHKLLSGVVLFFCLSVVFVSAQAIFVVNPSDGSTVTSHEVVVDFSVDNWTVGGKGEMHAHFHLDNVPGFTFDDHFMFYNSPDFIVELNTDSGTTTFATWIDADTLVFYDVPNGVHQLRAHLANADHSIPENPEADVTITFTVNTCVDHDGDGYGEGCDIGIDCDDTNVAIHPGAQELCDGLDNDCDGATDEGFNLGESCTNGEGACQNTGVLVCSNDGFSSVCNAIPGEPSEEVCDSIDNDCNGEVDDKIDDIITGTDDGVCQIGIQQCITGTFQTVQEEVGPTDELCNILDDNCNNQTDEGFHVGETCSAGVGACMNQGVIVCSQDQLSSQCDAIAGTPTEEVCDSIDNDCNGVTDDGISDIITGTDDGVCQVGIQACIAGQFQTTQEEVGPSDELCDGLDNDCDAGVDNHDVCSLPLQVFSPVNGIYNDDKFIFDIVADRKVDKLSYIDYSEQHPKERTLCSHCDSYGHSQKRTRSFSDGEHNLTFLVVKDDFHGAAPVSLFIDTKDPKVMKVEPQKGFTNGSLHLEFTEVNPITFTLHYGNEDTSLEQAIDIHQCTFDKKHQKYFCDVFVDLTGFEDQEVMYSSVLTDIVGNTGESKEKKVDVDTLQPIISLLGHDVNKGKVTFTVAVTEKNFDELDYIDFMDKKPVERRLCSRLKNGVCKEQRSFRKGEHHLALIVHDKANNMAQEFVDFTVL